MLPTHYIKIIALLFVLTVSCKSNDMALKKTIISTKILSGEHSNITEAKQLVVTSKEALQALFKNINKTRSPKVALPEINFKKELVLALFMGSKTSGGYATKIDHITVNKDAVYVYYTESYPKGMATSVMTQPYYLASYPKTDLPFHFKLMK